MAELINTLSMNYNYTNRASVVIMHYLLFHPLFSHNFPLVVGIHWDKHEFIFALAIKTRKYLHIVWKGSFSSLFFQMFVCVCAKAFTYFMSRMYSLLFSHWKLIFDVKFYTCFFNPLNIHRFLLIHRKHSHILFHMSEQLIPSSIALRHYVCISLWMCVRACVRSCVSVPWWRWNSIFNPDV